MTGKDRRPKTDVLPLSQRHQPSVHAERLLRTVQVLSLVSTSRVILLLNRGHIDTLLNVGILLTTLEGELKQSVTSVRLSVCLFVLDVSSELNNP